MLRYLETIISNTYFTEEEDLISYNLSYMGVEDKDLVRKVYIKSIDSVHKLYTLLSPMNDFNNNHMFKILIEYIFDRMDYFVVEEQFIGDEKVNTSYKDVIKDIEEFMCETLSIKVTTSKISADKMLSLLVDICSVYHETKESLVVASHNAVCRDEPFFYGWVSEHPTVFKFSLITVKLREV